jgi:TolB-like protein
MRYKGKFGKSLREIARELNVDATLDGTVAQAGQKVRITTQLIRASDDRAGRYGSHVSLVKHRIPKSVDPDS